MRGETVYVDDTAIDNVLVSPIEPSAAGAMMSTSIDEWQGRYADYSLYFPMTYTEPLVGKTVTVRGLECEVLGAPDHYRQKHVFGRWNGQWDMPVRVRRTIGTQAETIVLIAKTVSRDSIGKRTETAETLYEGDGQARMSAGSESGRNDGTEASTSYVFLIPWIDAINDYQPQHLFVEYNGRTYNIHSVENQDEKSITAVLRGEWRG